MYYPRGLYNLILREVSVLISFLRGQPIAFNEGRVTLLVGGVGYEVLISSATWESISDTLEVELYIMTHVRDDAIQLFGFHALEEKNLFLSLIGVNGIGPKLGLGILSACSLEKFKELIINEDVKGLSRLPKIGKKMAEQMVLSLKGKLPKSQVPHKSKTKEQIVSGLSYLGFKISEIERVLETIPESVTVQEGIRQGLAALTES